MSLKLQKVRQGFCILKLEHLIMQVLKYGKINHMIRKVTSGRSGVFYMKSLLCNRPLELKIWMVSFEKC